MILANKWLFGKAHGILVPITYAQMFFFNAKADKSRVARGLRCVHSPYLAHTLVFASNSTVNQMFNAFKIKEI